MGTRNTELWDVLPGQGAALVLLCGMFLTGGVVGCLYVGVSSVGEAGGLRDYLVDYLWLIREGEVTCSFWPILWEQLRWLLAVVLLGLTAVGLVGLPVLFCMRGFLFSFSVACFCRVFGGVGLLPALALFGMPALLWAPTFFLVGIQGFSQARQLLDYGSGKLLTFRSAYWMRASLCALLTLICSAAGYWVIPVLLRAVARVVL